MRPRTFLSMLLGAACITAASAQAPVESAIATTDSSAQQCPQENQIWGYCIPYDFNTFVYNLFVARTNDTAEPADVNDVYIVSNYDDDPNAFYSVFLLP